MNSDVEKLCDLVINNRNTLKKDMTWELDANTCALMAGLLASARGIAADVSKYEACKKLLYEKEGTFSGLRGEMQTAVLSKMMLSDDPEAYLKGLQEVYKKLGSLHKLADSAYIALAAMNIYDYVGTEGADAALEKLEELYKDTQRKHPFIVDGEDRGFLSMLAASGLDVAEAAKRIEETYAAGKGVLPGCNAPHSMAQILALSDKAPEEKVAFVKNLREKLEEKDCPISKDHGLPVLGALFLLDLPEEQLATEIAEASEYLKGKDGFKWYNNGKTMRTVYAALAVFLAHAKDQKELGSLISTNLAVNILEQLLLMIIIVTSVNSGL